MQGSGRKGLGTTPVHGDCQGIPCPTGDGAFWTFPFTIEVPEVEADPRFVPAAYPGRLLCVLQSCYGLFSDAQVLLGVNLFQFPLRVMFSRSCLYAMVQKGMGGKCLARH